jgi:hypothetical protein
VAGNVCINDCLIHYLVPELPFGGMKESGLGRRHGPEGIRAFCQTQAVLVDRFGLKKELTWPPYDRRVFKAMRRLLNLLFASGVGRRLR